MLPLHNTLVHWFWLEQPPSRLVSRLSRVGRGAVRLVTGEQEQFVAQTNDGFIPVTVTKLEKTPELISLHERACEELEKLGVVYEKPEYVREGFTPHITHQAGEVVDPNGYLSNNLYVVTADRPEYGNTRAIVAKIALSQD